MGTQEAGSGLIGNTDASGQVGRRVAERLARRAVRPEVAPLADRADVGGEPARFDAELGVVVLGPSGLAGEGVGLVGLLLAGLTTTIVVVKKTAP